MDSSSAPILNVATPWTATLMPWRETASARFDVDLAGGQLELADLVEERQDDDALAADDLEARPRRRRAASPGRDRISASFAPATL